MTEPKFGHGESQPKLAPRNTPTSTTICSPPDPKPGDLEKYPGKAARALPKGETGKTCLPGRHLPVSTCPDTPLDVSDVLMALSVAMRKPHAPTARGAGGEGGDTQVSPLFLCPPMGGHCEGHAHRGMPTRGYPGMGTPSFSQANGPAPVYGHSLQG